MAIQPIDLQVLFSRLNQVGREQAVQRDAQIQAQAVAGNEIAERSEEGDHRVAELSTDEEGPENVGDDSEGKQGSSRQGHREKDDDEAKESIFRDPDLGQNVDISG